MELMTPSVKRDRDGLNIEFELVTLSQQQRPSSVVGDPKLA